MQGCLGGPLLCDRCNSAMVGSVRRCDGVARASWARVGRERKRAEKEKESRDSEKEREQRLSEE